MTRPKKIELFIVIEGGSKGKQNDARFREGYRQFLDKFVPKEIEGRPVAMEIIRGDGRSKAHDKFKSQRTLHPDALIVLLIDSDALFPQGSKIWDFLESRDKIEKPSWATESHAYLMVQCVETWLVADPDSLAVHYGKDFKKSSLPARNQIEDKPHPEVQKALEAATAKCRKPYDHSDSPDLIAVINPTTIEDLKHIARLKEGLKTAVEEFAETSP